jgi:hypothetical protein
LQYVAVRVLSGSLHRERGSLTDEGRDGGEDGEVDELERDPGDPVHDVVDAERAAEGVDEVGEEHGHERHRGAVGHGAEHAQHHQRHVRAVRKREQPVERHPAGGLPRRRGLLAVSLGRRRRGIRLGVSPRLRHVPPSIPAHRDLATYPPPPRQDSARELLCAAARRMIDDDPYLAAAPHLPRPNNCTRIQWISSQRLTAKRANFKSNTIHI